MVDRTGTMPDGVRHDQAEKLVVTRRRAVAANMRRSGATYQQIADNAVYPDTGERCYPPGTHKSTVYVDIQRGLKEAVTDLHLNADELREQTAQRLDNYLLRLDSGIKMGDPKAIAEARRIEEFRARLYGYAEPERVEVITADALDVEIRRLRDEIGRRAALAARQGGTGA